MKSFTKRKRPHKVQKGGWPWTTRKNATKYLTTTPTGSGFVYPTSSATASLRFEKDDLKKFIADIIFKIKSKLPSAEAEPFGKILSYPLTEVLYGRLKESTSQQQSNIEKQVALMPNLIKLITIVIRLWKYAKMSAEKTADDIANALIDGWVRMLQAELSYILEWIRENHDSSLYPLLFAEFKELDKLYVSNYLMSCSTEIDAKLEAIKTAGNPLLKSLKDYLAYEPGSTFSFSRKTRSKRTCTDRLPVSNGPVMSNSASAFSVTPNASAIASNASTIPLNSVSASSVTPNASAIASNSSTIPLNSVSASSVTPNASAIASNSASAAAIASNSASASAIASTSASREAAIASNSLSNTTRAQYEAAREARAAASAADERLFDTIVRETGLIAKIDEFIKLLVPVMMMYIANNTLTTATMKNDIPLILTKIYPELLANRDFISFIIVLIPSDPALIQRYIDMYNEDKDIPDNNKIELLRQTVGFILSAVLNNFITLITTEGPNLAKQQLEQQIKEQLGIPASLLINFFGLIGRQLPSYNITQISYLNEPEHIADITKVVTTVIECFTPPAKLCPPGWRTFSLQTPTQIMDAVVYAILFKFLGSVTGTLAKGVFNRFGVTRTAIISGLTTFLEDPAYNSIYRNACQKTIPTETDIRMFAVNMLFVVIRSVQSIPADSWSGINGLIQKVKPEFQGISEALKRLEWTLYYTYNFPPWYLERSAVKYGGGRRRRTRRTKK